MRCPSCGRTFDVPVARCPHCRLSLQRLDLKFGMVPRHSRFLTDRTGKIPLSDMRQLRAALRLFEKKFPQMLFSVFVDHLPAGTSVSEFTFWMANRARFSSVEKRRADNFDLLLVIDLATRSAALTTGYGLEPFVKETDLDDVLAPLAGPLGEGNVAVGIRASIEALTRRLREISKQLTPTAEADTGEVLAHAS
ncbi:MAG: TPM domain-containing protein [Verrucomicrobiota bacterium]|nr:TPM domain-containing protein [Verrucomicrobiota bacterium]